MSYYYNKCVKLKDAMTMNLKQTIRFWNVPDLQVNGDLLPENALVNATFVMKLPDGSLYVGVYWETDDDEGSYMSTVGEFKTLDELQEKFPSLLDLYGCLSAIA